MNPQELIRSWLKGRAWIDEKKNLHLHSLPSPSLTEKFQRAYRWLSSTLPSPYLDVEFGAPITIGQGRAQVVLPSSSGYASFLLFPLLCLMTKQRLLIVGAPGHGKTTIAMLMSMLCSTPPEEVRRTVQHGHPQLTIADLLGSPLPNELIQAKESKDIKVSWRAWLRKPVKIIDEYNRIPTKTQSALLSLMSEGYCEMYEQVLYCGRSAWFLTANDELGGGTFQVIEALKDRIDMVIRCTPFHSRFLSTLTNRLKKAHTPTDFVPEDICFTEEELNRVEAELRTIEIPSAIEDILGFFASQLSFCGRASHRLEYKNKDTLHLSGRRVSHVCTEDCPLDKQENLCTQSENGVSPRAYQSLLLFAKALAYFRGNTSVSQEDIAQLLPWILWEKLRPNPSSAFFQRAENQVFLIDRLSWIRNMFESAVTQYSMYAVLRKPIDEIVREFEMNPPKSASKDLQNRLEKIRVLLEDLAEKNELSAPIYEDMIFLKSLYSQYQRELSRMGSQGSD